MGIPSTYCSCVRDCNDKRIEARFSPHNTIEFPKPLNRNDNIKKNHNKQQSYENTSNNTGKLTKTNNLVTKQSLESVGDELNKKEKSKNDFIICIQSIFRGFSYRKKFNDNIKENLKNSDQNTISTLKKLYTNKSYTILLPFIENPFNEEIYKNNNKLKTNCLIKKYEDDEDCLYKGEIDINKNFDGYGELFLKNGKKYEGFFKNNKLNGEGKLYDTNNTCYEGNFTDNILNGIGKITKINDKNSEIIYKGNIENFKKSGFGKETSSDYTYEGNFMNDLKNGEGKLTYIDGDYYEGEFKDGEITGTGHYIWTNKHEYNGTFVNGKMHGKGIYKWPDGSKYEGEYINNIKEGNGEFRWKDGRIFKGPFTDGKPNGIGVLIYNGHKTECEFKYGKFNGKIQNRSKTTMTGEITGSS